MKRSNPTTISRRAALAGLGAAAGAAACRRGWMPPGDDPTGLAIDKPDVPGENAYATREERWFRSACGQCPAGCGIRVRVVEGRAVRIEGDRDNPLNRGGIGARGLSALQALYDADRIEGPLRRDGDTLVPVSWDDALGQLAGALTALRARAPEQLLIWCGHERGAMHELFERLARSYGTPSFVDGRRDHTGPLAQVMNETLGVAEVPVFGWEDARTVISLEAGLLEGTCQSVYFTRMAAQRRRDAQGRTRLVHAGPILDLSAYNADEWLRIVPGTSGALALGLVREILLRHPDERLPETLIAGIGELRTMVSDYTPGHVEALTGVSPDTLARIAADLDEHRPSFAYVDEHSLAFSNGVDTARAAMTLNAVLGAFWAETGGVRAAPPPPLPPWDDLELDPVATAALVRPACDGTIEALEHAPPAIAMFHHANPAYARAQPARWQAALAKIPLVVSFSPYRDETVESCADLVLPDHTFLERWEIASPAPALAQPILTRRVPVIAALHDTRPSGDVVLELARRLGGSVAAAMPWRTYRAALEERLAALTSGGEDHDAYWLGNAPAPAPARVTVTASYTPPAWRGDADAYPLGLLLHRPLGYAEGSGANQPWLRGLSPRPGTNPWWFAARIHPSSADDLRDGDVVTLESEWGAIQIAVQLDENVAAGYVLVPQGAGHTAFGRWAKGFGANPLDLIPPGPVCTTRVRFRRGSP